MRIAYITAGAAGMYCGSCLHDNTLAKAMIGQGHDVALVPLYTPIRTDEEDVSIDRVFYGAINVYLEQKTALFRHTPRLIDRLLRAPALIDWVARRGASSTDARALGALTLSVLEGEEGRQRKELDQLVAWLRDEYRPDVVHLSNSMLAGLARRARAELGCPVICSVQGEDLFLDQLVEPWLGRVRDKLRERAADVAGFVATSRYYADYMAQMLGVGADRMHRVPMGVNLDGFEHVAPSEAEGPFVVGYLARLCPEKGLHLLADAFELLTKKLGPGRARLRIAGYLGRGDRAYRKRIADRFAARGLAGAVDWAGELDRRQKIDFLRSLDVLSVPTVYREPKGLFVLEALACGVPVVQPRHGAFPEMLEATGGGVLVEPGSPEALAAALHELCERPAERRRLGAQGRAALAGRYDDATMARNTVAVYERYLPRKD